MTYAELTRKLKKLGVEFQHQAKGSHEVWWHPASERFTRIAYHSQREIPKGTLARILRDLGITEADLHDA
jgi:predicted RNA binding protein YcfA (HicA-like mRNA interferase family)